MKISDPRNPFALISLLVSMTLTGLLHGQVPISIKLSGTEVQVREMIIIDHINDISVTIQSDDQWYDELGKVYQNGLAVFPTGLSVLWKNSPSMTLSFSTDTTITGFTAKNPAYLTGKDTSGNYVMLSNGTETVQVDLNRQDYTIGQKTDLATPIMVSAGQTLTLTATTPDGANFNNVRWSYLHVTAVPEPSIYALLVGSLALIGVAIHRKRRR